MKNITQDDLDKLNKIVEWAILHGGDGGGPYLVEPDNLQNAVEDFIKSQQDELEMVWCKYEGGEWVEENKEYSEKSKKYPISYPHFLPLIRFKKER